MAGARKKGNLPSSLELLLDTMCNTFGGIVFIAIALVIITQVSTRVVRETATHQPTEEEIAALEKEIHDALERLKDLKAQRLAEELARRNLPPEARELIAKARRLMDENDVREQQKDEQTRQTEDAENKAAESRQQVETLHDDLARSKQDEENARDSLETTKQEATAIKRTQAQLEAAIQKLKRTLDRTVPPQTVRLSMEESSGGEEVSVFLIGGRLYQVDELETRELRGDSVRVLPRPGAGHACNATELRRLFQGVSPQRQFVYAWVGDNSFDAFVALRNYLRTRNIRFGWAYTANFEFTRVKNATRDTSL